MGFGKKDGSYPHKQISAILRMSVTKPKQSLQSVLLVGTFCFKEDLLTWKQRNASFLYRADVPENIYSTGHEPIEVNYSIYMCIKSM